MANTLKASNLTLSALLFASLPNLVGAEACFDDSDPQVLSEQKNRLMEGEYSAFFDTLS